MEGLQRSESSFRRQGSSGLVWDDKLLSGELRKNSTGKDQDNIKAKAAAICGGRVGDGGGGLTYRTMDIGPAAEPPSPRLSGCGICGVFGKKKPAKSKKPKHGGHR